MLAEMTEHELTIRDYLRHSNLQCHQPVFADDIEEQVFCAGEVGGSDSAAGILAKNNSGSMIVCGRKSETRDL